MSQYGNIIFLVAIVVAFYFLIIRPQQQRSKQQQDMMSSLGVGAEIMTVGGIYATIISIEDDRILVELYDGTQMEIAKRAVGSVVSPRPHAEEIESDEEPPVGEEPEDAEVADHAPAAGETKDDAPDA